MGVYYSNKFLNKFSNKINKTFEITKLVIISEFLTKNENTKKCKIETEKLKNIKPSKSNKDSDHPMFMMLCLN